MGDPWGPQEPPRVWPPVCPAVPAQRAPGRAVSPLRGAQDPVVGHGCRPRPARGGGDPGPSRVPDFRTDSGSASPVRTTSGRLHPDPAPSPFPDCGVRVSACRGSGVLLNCPEPEELTELQWRAGPAPPTASSDAKPPEDCGKLKSRENAGQAPDWMSVRPRLEPRLDTLRLRPLDLENQELQLTRGYADQPRQVQGCSFP